MSNDLFSTSGFQVSLPEVPAAKGHIAIDSSEDNLEDFFFMASYGATALFELVKAQGSNLIVKVTNQGAHADIIARQPDDGLNFMWEPTQANPAELQDLAKQIKDTLDEKLWALEHSQEQASALSEQSEQTPQQTVQKEPAKDLPDIYKRNLRRKY